MSSIPVSDIIVPTLQWNIIKLFSMMFAIIPRNGEQQK